MRRILVAGLCALYLVCGSVAGLAHVHEAADHHQEARGLHLDHAHVDHPAEPHGDHHDRQQGGHDPAGALPDHYDADARIDGRHADHHQDDAVYVSQSAVRSLPNLRVLPAIVTIAIAIEFPVLVGASDGVRPGRPRDPPRKTPPRLRAPPA